MDIAATLTVAHGQIWLCLANCEDMPKKEWLKI